MRTHVPLDTLVEQIETRMAPVTDDCCNHDLLSGPDATSDARLLAVRGFSALWHGHQPRVADLGVDDAVLVRQVQAGRLELDSAGCLVGVHGLVARPTAYRIEHADGAVHTWCALDAIGIPAALALTAIAITHCRACGDELRVSFDRGVPNDDGSVRLWVPSGPCTHLIEDFCRHTNLFCNASHLAMVVPAEASGQVITVTEAATIGHSAWGDVCAILQDQALE